jgi:hypothetical protein
MANPAFGRKGNPGQETPPEEKPDHPKLELVFT